MIPNKWKRKIEDFLQKKYKEEFIAIEIETIYPFLDVPYKKATFFPKRNPNIVCEMELSLLSTIKGDNYMNVIMNQEVDRWLRSMTKDTFQKETFVSSFIRLNTDNRFPPHDICNSNMRLHEYLHLIKEDGYTLESWIFVKSEGEIDYVEESKKIEWLTDKMLSVEVNNIDIMIFYVNVELFDQIMRLNEIELGQLDTFILPYWSKRHIFAITEIGVSNGEKADDSENSYQEQLIYQFEERDEYLRKNLDDPECL